MTNSLKNILKFLNDTNYLIAKCVLDKNEKMRCESSLLKNGLLLREQICKQLWKSSPSWATPYGGTNQKGKNQMEFFSRLSFLQNSEFQKSYKQICKDKLVNSSKSIVLQTSYNNISNSFISEEDNFYGSENSTFLVSEYFVAKETALSKFYNLQRERKIWWMRFSANPSRYSVVPFDLCTKENDEYKIGNESKSISIKANFPFGLVDMESITLVPLYNINSLNSNIDEDSLNISLLRSVINLDLITCDACHYGSRSRINALMLNRKLAPYQILLASLHRGDKVIEELALHLEHVISKSGLRLYNKSIHTNTQLELQKNLIYFDNLGIPYALVVDDKSPKNGLIKLRSRDTTLFETIHISDIPTYLLNIFENKTCL
ncbi:DNA polymerase subunit gamma-2, mitochondrial isoform X1 [Lucilia sericata]|uniref:DNA polymerase subunit gamma-2, mitochondrial isoform X1 n=1 Tax=Lucilia sericata TaxID=13632 RepID=UPI0018A84DB9|nr:DNA polymerase subunit gamma-2, mitochondrial isoform X1 [Lucilia sericata]